MPQLRMAGPIFDQSIALEMLTFMDEDVREVAAAIREKRPTLPLRPLTLLNPLPSGERAG
jgi:hypothetical protein